MMTTMALAATVSVNQEAQRDYEKDAHIDTSFLIRWRKVCRRTIQEYCNTLNAKYGTRMIAQIMKYAATMSHIRLTSLLRILGFCAVLFNGTFSLSAQTPVALMPEPRITFTDNNGQPMAGACIFSYSTNTSTPLATFSESTGTTQNQNPTIADGGGKATIFLQAQIYRIAVWGNGGVNGNNCASGFQLYQVDGVSDKGLIALASGSLLLNPAGRALQTVAGPLTADQFNGPVSQLLPSVGVKTATNGPTINTTNPLAAGQIYNIPDPLTPTSHFVLDAGATNTLDCTDGIVTCKRTGTYYFPGASCNNGVSAIGWDSFGGSSPVPSCVSGTNTVRGQMGLTSAYTHIQQNTGVSSAAGTVTTTYPAAIPGGNGDLLVVSIAFNATTTITGCTDGTNAYSQGKHIANGSLSVDVWYFLNAVTKTAGTTLTCTFTAPATSALKWHEYQTANAISLDVTASNSGTGTAVTTGATASTAQATELVFAATGNSSLSSLTASTTGYADHLFLTEAGAANMEVDDAGMIQQAIAAQNAGFTIGASQPWAAAILTFKAANTAGFSLAQRTIVLPSFFNPAQTVSAVIKWTNPFIVIGTTQAFLGVQIACVADGNTDDPVFGVGAQVATSISTVSTGILTSTTIPAFTPTGCASGNTMHLQLTRAKYNVADVYEGLVNVVGVNLAIGISQ